MIDITKTMAAFIYHYLPNLLYYKLFNVVTDVGDSSLRSSASVLVKLWNE